MTESVPQRADHASIPRQRTSGDDTVLVLLSAEEPHAAQVERGAQEAAARRLPLQIAILGLHDAGAARCMAAMDDAVMVAKRAAPDVELRVETEALEPARMSVLKQGRHPVVVSSQRTRDTCADDSGLQWVNEGHLIVL